MLKFKTTAQYRRDYKRIMKRGYDIDKIENVIDTLLAGKQLSGKFKDHALTGEYIGFRECHVLPDWLLIYRIDNDELVLIAFRTGTHADLFDK